MLWLVYITYPFDPGSSAAKDGNTRRALLGDDHPNFFSDATIGLPHPHPQVEFRLFHVAERLFVPDLLR